MLIRIIGLVGLFLIIGVGGLLRGALGGPKEGGEMLRLHRTGDGVHVVFGQFLEVIVRHRGCCGGHGGILLVRLMLQLILQLLLLFVLSIRRPCFVQFGAPFQYRGHVRIKESIACRAEKATGEAIAIAIAIVAVDVVIIVAIIAVVIV